MVLQGILLVALGLVVVVAAIFIISLGRLYIQALSSGCRTAVSVFIGMWLR